MVLTEEEIEEILDGLHDDIRDGTRNVLSSDYSSDPEEVKVGLEVEYGIIDDSLEPANSETRDKAIDDLNYAHKEVGASMVELVTDPTNLKDLTQLEEDVSQKENELSLAMDEENLSMIRYGTNPFVDIQNVPLTEPEDPDEPDRYQELVDHFESHRDEDFLEFGSEESVNPNSAGIVGAICSTQLNIQASDFEDAVEKANYLNMFQPYVVAAMGNSRIVEGQDTGHNDTRMQLWEMNYNSEDPDRRKDQSGMIDPYLEDKIDYLSRLDPVFSSENQPDDAIAEYWKDARIKFYDGDKDEHDKGIVVEGRLISTQPSVEEDIAAQGFLIGRLNYAQQNNEDLLDEELLRNNRENAMASGLDSKLYDSEGSLNDAGEVVRAELEKAKEGLEDLGIGGQKYFDLLEERSYGPTPSEDSVNAYNAALEQDYAPDEALARAMPIVEPVRDVRRSKLER